ncbi:helicase associated domain-containing protein, partial [Candidatus Magnetaquicoccus inordinatus]|uniref:helicase associated domain-containing protein n=1 Tax=Candidatus Magnetaquicoccus inordinatus TaxID=2496818 RepID=UPI00187D2705
TPAFRQSIPGSADAEGGNKRILHLLDQSLYGRAMRVAPLAQAVAEGVLRPWQLWILLLPPSWLAEDQGGVRLLARSLRTLLGSAGSAIGHVQIVHGSVADARLAAAADPLSGMQMVADDASGQGQLSSGWLSLLLDATLTAAEREQIIRRYHATPRVVLHSARCLVDGAQLPLADLLLCSPLARKVKWDLLRSLSAVLAKNYAGVSTFAAVAPGIICVPVFAAKAGGELYSSAEEALTAADLLWEVVQRLREADEQFEQQIVRSGEQLGRQSLLPWQAGADPALAWHNRIRFLLPEGIPEGWRNALWTGLFRHLSSEWDRRFGLWQAAHAAQAERNREWEEQQRKAWRKGSLRADWQQRLQEAGFVFDPKQVAWEEKWCQLQAYSVRYGHADVPAGWPENPSLAEWVQQQRREFGKGRLAAQAVQRLQELDFVWDPELVRWEGMFEQFLLFYKQYGHGQVPEICTDYPDLAQWAKEQRQDLARGKLAIERQVRLSEWGFCWDLEAAWWEEQFRSLCRFQEREGDLLVPPSWPEDPLLADWVAKQRRDWRSGRLLAERRQRLEDLGFVWDPEELAWQQQWSLLQAFHAQHGHCHVTESQQELAEWVRQQRKAGLAGSLSQTRREALQALDFIWEPRAAEWDAMLMVLRQFCQEHKHCIIPANYADNPVLARWVGQVRRAYAAGQLSDEQIKQLQELGFVWDAKAVLWEEMFAALAEFRRYHGNALVPENYPANPQLAWWVVTQRKAYKSGQLEEERISRLNKLGFFWDPLEVQWYEMYIALVHYRQQYGRVVITRGTADARLSSWVNMQRQARQHGNLSAKRVELLDALGFVWEQKDVVLEEMLAELAQFRERHGHCNVPASWPGNPALGLWAQFQRQEYKKGSLDGKRIERLQALGFVWE